MKQSEFLQHVANLYREYKWLTVDYEVCVFEAEPKFTVFSDDAYWEAYDWAYKSTLLPSAFTTKSEEKAKFKLPKPQSLTKKLLLDTIKVLYPDCWCVAATGSEVHLYMVGHYPITIPMKMPFKPFSMEMSQWK